MGQLINLLQKSQPLSYYAALGRVFYASDADENDKVTGQTSFVNTTPTFLIDVPTGVTVIPLMIALNQSGTVAGADIDIIVSIDDAEGYSSGGTEETIFSSRTDQVYANDATASAPAGVKVYSNPTAAAGYGARIDGITLGPDVSPAEGAVQQYLYTPTGTLDYVVGPGCLKVFTYAGTTGPTWFWSIKFLVIPTSELPVNN